jgi:hypothetical protein
VLRRCWITIVSFNDYVKVGQFLTGLGKKGVCLAFQVVQHAQNGSWIGAFLESSILEGFKGYWPGDRSNQPKRSEEEEERDGTKDELHVGLDEFFR